MTGNLGSSTESNSRSIIVGRAVLRDHAVLSSRHKVLLALPIVPCLWRWHPLISQHVGIPSTARTWQASVLIEKKREDYIFWRQLNEKPSSIPGCRAHVEAHTSDCCRSSINEQSPNCANTVTTSRLTLAVRAS